MISINIDYKIQNVDSKTITDMNHFIKNEFPIAAARNGNLELLKSLKSNGYDISTQLINTAASYGHLHILIWLHQNKFKFDKYTMLNGVCSGNIEVVKWLHSLNIGCEETASLEAARKGYYDILKFMISNGMYIDKWCTVEAIKNGHIECLELLLEKHYYSCVKYHMVTHLSMNMNKLNLDKYPLVLKFFVDNSETLLTFSELDKYVKDYLYLKFINSM